LLPNHRFFEKRIPALANLSEYWSNFVLKLEYHSMDGE
jgi:hypothetical protein